VVKLLYIIKLIANSMKNQIFVAISVAIVASVLVTGFAPAFAQPTTGTPSPSTAPGGGTTTGGGGDFAEFMQCLNAAGPSPTTEDVTSCYDPIYGSGAGDEEASDEDDGDTQDDGNEGTADDGGG
jgi:hypothetical protein